MPRRRKQPLEASPSPGSDRQAQSSKGGSSPASSGDQSPQLKAVTGIFADLFPAERASPSAKAKLPPFSLATKTASPAANTTGTATIPVPRKPTQAAPTPNNAGYPPGFAPQASAPKPPPPHDLTTSTSGVPLGSFTLTSHADINTFRQLPQTTLTSLTITIAPLTTDAISDIVLLDLPLLQSLSLASNQLNSDTMAYLIKGRWPKLTSLDLSDNALDRDAIQLLGGRSPWPCLERLNLNSNHIDSGAMAHLINGKWPSLQYLDLGLNEMDFLAVSELVKGKWPELKGLALGKHIAQDAVHILIKEPTANKIEWPGLEELDLSCNPLLDAGAMSKLVKGQWPWLHTLSLANSSRDASCMSKLSKGNWPHLRNLDLSNNALDAVAIQFMMKYQKWRKMENLNLSANKLDMDAFKLLVKVKWDNLKKLDLSRNILSSAIVAPLQLAEWPALEVLILANNEVSASDLPDFDAEMYSLAAAADGSDPPGYLQFQLLQVLDVNAASDSPVRTFRARRAL
ncbi:hypothetical protein WJX77_011261 [Trebouxia sp. C0004]